MSEMLVYCGQMVGWIKMKLGMEVGLSPGLIVLGKHPFPHPKGAEPPNFPPISVAAKWLDMIKMPRGREVGLYPSNIVLDGDPSPIPKKGGRAPNFWPMSIVAKQLD